MDKILKIASIAICFVLLWVFGACSDDTFLDEQGQQGVDMSRMVEVKVPFGISKGLTSHIVTRADGTTDQSGKDSQLSGIMVFVYENTGQDATNDKLLSFQLFESPLTSLEGSTGGWTPDGEDYTQGFFKLYLPKGDIYIYLIGNATGSFIDFFPKLGDNQLQNRQDFLDNVTPKWNGNMFTVDGYLPLVGTVNNNTGACHVKINNDNNTGTLTYKKEGEEKEYVISQNKADKLTADNSFVLKRLMCKVSMKFINGKGVTFTPKNYKFYHCSQYVSPAKDQWIGQYILPTIDTETVTFDAQTPNEFTVYLPENVRVYEGEKTDWTFADRDRVAKDKNGKNLYEKITDEGHEKHYKFENAPHKSTYVEITGDFEGDNISADTKYILHLGDFSNNKFNDFSLKRDHHYQYTVTVKGVDDIVVEVQGEDGTGTNPQEKNPAVEGIVFKGGARVQLDAHYEQVEMKLMKKNINEGVYIYAETPFGRVNCKYIPKKNGGSFDSSHINTPNNIEDAQKLLQWIEFKKQSGKGSLASYGGNGDRMNLFAALDDVCTNGDAYYTCFVDEYYYTKNPTDNSEIKLSDFINAEDRTFSLGSQIFYSKDGQSAVATAVYVLQQHSIACFYDLENQTVAKYGVELTDEIGGLPYGSPASTTAEAKNGRENTQIEIGQNRGVVNWAKNGFLLDANDSKLEVSQDRLNANSKWGCLACLTRNRDFNGNDRIDDDELRWYTPARDQMLGLWIGEPALPAKAALLPYSTDKLIGNPKKSNYPIYTSTNGNNRIIWAEEGCSFGPDKIDDIGTPNSNGYVRVVRNLGRTPSLDSYSTNADAYYDYNLAERTIEVFLSDNALRSFSYRELAPHHERSVVNRPYKKFQVAAQPYTKEATATCSYPMHWGEDQIKYQQLQTTNATQAKTATTTIAANYKGNGEANLNTTSVWRLPNQRELALMVVAMGTTLGYNMNDYDTYHTINCECTRNSWVPARHEWTYTHNYVLHCRTSFSNTDYTAFGYIYHIDAKHIRMYGGDLGRDGTGGYLCVRDVPAP